MSRTIQHPFETRGRLRAVAHGSQDVSVYDDSVDENKAVWNDTTLDKAVEFMELVNPYLGAFAAYEHNPCAETKAARQTAFDLLHGNAQIAATVIAVARFACDEPAPKRVRKPLDPETQCSVCWRFAKDHQGGDDPKPTYGRCPVGDGDFKRR